MLQLYRVYIQPILLYGSETWALTRALKDRIAAFDNFCLRRILRIPYQCYLPHVTNADVRLRVGSPPQLLPLIQTRRLVSLGMWHRWATPKTLSEPYIRRPAGCPRTGDAAQDVHPCHTWLRTLNAQPRTQLSMATCRGQRTMEATRGNGYAPAWGSLVMMICYMQVNCISITWNTRPDHICLIISHSY